MGVFSELFIWWGGNTLGTRLFTWRKGEFVGEDEAGNKYYQEKGGKRRWVIYNGPSEASAIAADWHGWLHYTTDTPPTEEHYIRRPWQKPHQANMTGTSKAYRPKGSTLSEGERPPATGDYTAWSPE